jgi:hypothetical protein
MDIDVTGFMATSTGYSADTPPSVRAVSVVLPAETPVRMPLLVTIATEGFEDRHEIDAVACSSP